MLIEAPVFGREHRLDQVIGKLVERDRVVVPDAARADLVAVTIEEGDRQLGFLQPVIVRCFAKRRDRQRQHHHQADGAERGAFGDQLVEPAPPAGDVEAVHEGREALIGLAQAGEAAENAEIHPRIERQQEPLDPGFPLLGEGVAQGAAARKVPPGGPPDRNVLADRATRGQCRGSELNSGKVNGNCGGKGAVPQAGEGLPMGFSRYDGTRPRVYKGLRGFPPCPIHKSHSGAARRCQK